MNKDYYSHSTAKKTRTLSVIFQGHTEGHWQAGDKTS